jgi:hypothetical protein
LIDRGSPRLDRTAAGCAQRTDGLDDPMAWFGRGGSGASQHRAGGGLGVDWVGLATLPAGTPVRPVDLNDFDAVVEQVSGQAGAVAAGAFHLMDGGGCPVLVG